MSNILLSVLAVVLSASPLFADQPCRSTVVGDLRIESLQSKTYGKSVSVRIWLPPGYQGQSPQAKYPTLYMLDGQTLFDECTAFHGEHELRMDEAVTSLIQRGKLPPMIIVGIDSSNRRSYEYSPYPDILGDPLAPEPIGKQLPAFFADEVLPFVSAQYRVTDNPSSRGIGGTSLGAAAALYVSLKRPDLFRLALLESPTLILGNGQLLRDTTLLARAPDRVAIGVGTAELHFPNIAQFLAPLGLSEQLVNDGTVHMVETLAANLRGAFLKPSEVMLVVEPNANHSSHFWAQRIPDAICFLFGPPRTR